MKNKMIKSCVILTVFILTITILQSCATIALPTEPMKFNATSEKGLLIGTVTFPTDKPNFSGYFFRLTNNTSDEFQINRSQPGQLDGGRTYLFALELIPGTYEIPSVRLFNNSGFVAGQYDVRTGGFSIPYTVEKGKTTYIGNINFNDYAKKGDVVVTLKNNFEKDVAELKKVQPSLDLSEVQNDLNRKIEYNDKKARL